MKSADVENVNEAVEELYRVVVNDEEQYSIWPVSRELPAGWRDAGRQGTRQECLAHIDEVWTDMRPLSLRQRMAETVQRAAGATA
ncbi:MbtH family NRPS accessory protein [Streptomyces sp. NPDC007070]|uniref:MbtH family protein n=1 Tax=Streptomyces sp. NPDC007070 TaxID=3154312 RepID=UPI0033FD2B88